MINEDLFIEAKNLRACLTALGGDENFNEVEYIEIHPPDQFYNYTEHVVDFEAIFPPLHYDEIKSFKHDTSF